MTGEILSAGSFIAHRLDPYDLPDGVYLNLPAAIYFAQRVKRLGSSDLMRLHRYKSGWWWMSEHNPDRLTRVTDSETGEERWVPASKPSDAQNYGSALHAIMLEGERAYEDRFLVEPDRRDFPRLLASVIAIKRELHALPRWSAPPGVSEWTSEDWALEAAAYMPGRPIWAEIKADFDKLRGVRATVSAVEDRMLRLMHRTAIDPTNPDNVSVRGLLGAEEEFPVLAEVSVFWTDGLGVRRRARIDRFAPLFTVDLKSLGNWQGRSLRYGLSDHIRKEGYDIQLGDHHVSRRVAYKMALADNVTGGSEEQRLWLRAIAERELKWSYVYLFYQKPDAAKGLAPILFPLEDEFGSPMHVEGLRKGLRARDFYLTQVERYGLDAPWTVVEPLHYTDERFVPHIHPGFATAGEASYAGEEEFLTQ